MHLMRFTPTKPMMSSMNILTLTKAAICYSGVQLPDADPITFNAEDYKDNYVTEPSFPRTVGSFACWGKKTEDTAE